MRARGFGREAHRDVARLAGRVHPVAGVDAGERRPQRLRDVADAKAQRAGQLAVDLHVELGLLSARRQADVDRAGHLAHERQRLVGQRAERRRRRGRSAAPESASGCRSRWSGSTPWRRRASAKLLRESSARSRPGGPVALGLGHQADVDRALVDGAGRAADRRVGVRHARHRPRDGGHFLELPLRVVEVRSRRRLHRRR